MSRCAITFFAVVTVVCAQAAFHPAQTSKSATRSVKEPAPSRPARAAVSSKASQASGELAALGRALVARRASANYQAVEAFAARQRGENAALAWLVAGYARLQDKQYEAAAASFRKAAAAASVLPDYVAYHLALALRESGRHEEAAAALQDFRTKYPDSVWSRDALLLHAAALVSAGKPQPALALLRASSLSGPDIELASARAYQKAGDTSAAVRTRQSILYEYPLSWQADIAGRELAAMSDVPAVSFQLRRERAMALVGARRFTQAARELRPLVKEASAGERPALAVSLAAALRQSGNRTEAREILERMTEPRGEAAAARLLELLEIARSERDTQRVTELLQKLRLSAPESASLQAALLSAANMHLLNNELERSAQYFRELQQRFPGSDRASYALWKSAWLNLRLGNREEARRGCEKLVELYPGSSEIPAALYWRGRIAEDEGERATAAAWYQKLSTRFRNYYYADRARERLGHMGGAVKPRSVALLERIPPAPVPAAIPPLPAPADDLHLERSRLLRRAGLTDLAAKELSPLSTENPPAWVVEELASLYQEAGQPHRALQLMKRSVLSPFVLDPDDLPAAYWQALFPRPFWRSLEKEAESNRLDPFLVAALVRQESEFNPGAVSPADAMGLMQVRPATGRALAHQVKMPGFSSNALLQPNTNLRLGTRYLRNLLERFEGHLEYALAAYNAGPDRVTEWLARGPYRDRHEFVEAIPFTETREYVQAVLRNAEMYRRLYGQPLSAASRSRSEIAATD